jgi:hypothetical protein
MDEEPRDVRLPLMVTRSEAAAIDAWRYANHVPSRAEAIRRLIEAGLRAEGAPAHHATTRSLERTGGAGRAVRKKDAAIR